jgi:hypothetical protein
MYYPDLTEYSYAKQIGDEDRSTLNIGWLDPDHQFPEGEVEPELIDQLRRLCVTSQVNVMRGIHVVLSVRSPPALTIGVTLGGMGSRHS